MSDKEDKSMSDSDGKEGTNSYSDGGNSEDFVGLAPDGSKVTKRELRLIFWKLVVLFNIGPILLVLGLFMIYFEKPSRDFGVPFALAGALTTAWAFYLYRTKAPDTTVDLSSETGPESKMEAETESEEGS